MSNIELDKKEEVLFDEPLIIEEVIAEHKAECEAKEGALDIANMLLDKFFPNRTNESWKHICCYGVALISNDFDDAVSRLKKIRSNHRHHRNLHRHAGKHK